MSCPGRVSTNNSGPSLQQNKMIPRGGTGRENHMNRLAETFMHFELHSMRISNKEMTILHLLSPLFILPSARCAMFTRVTAPRRDITLKCRICGYPRTLCGEYCRDALLFNPFARPVQAQIRLAVTRFRVEDFKSGTVAFKVPGTLSISSLCLCTPECRDIFGSNKTDSVFYGHSQVCIFGGFVCWKHKGIM